MDMVSLSASVRPGKKPNQLRLSGTVPCIVYGNHAHMDLTVSEGDAKKAYVKAGESTLVELEVAGEKIPVLFHEIAQDPVSDRITHIDFYAVDMKKEVETEVKLRFTGEAPAVKTLGAILVTAAHAVTVRCLPKDLPHELTADLSKLAEMGDVLHVSDLTPPTGVKIVDKPDTVIVIAQQPREEEKAEVVAAAVPAEGAAATPTDGTAAPAPGTPATPAAPAAPVKEEKKGK